MELRVCARAFDSNFELEHRVRKVSALKARGTVQHKMFVPQHDVRSLELHARVAMQLRVDPCLHDRHVASLSRAPSAARLRLA